jgi:hypothetical protein
MNMKTVLTSFIAVAGIFAAQTSKADLVASSDMLFYAAQPIGTETFQSVVITNTGTTTLFQFKPVIPGAESGNQPFTLSNCPTELFAGLSCEIVVKFLPTHPGKARKTLVANAVDAAGNSYTTDVRLESAILK